jgi:tetratricopeptide (TPR) repeat protein
VKADKSGSQGVAGEAAWEAATIRRAAELRTRVTRELLDYARTYPGASHAIEALMVATVDGNLAVAERNALWRRLVEANKAKPGALNEIVYDALAAGALDAALDAAKRQVDLTKGSANSLDSLAEVYHARGDKAEALAREDQALALLAADAPDRKPLEANRTRFAADKVADDGTIELRAGVAQRWKQLGSLERGGTESNTMSEIVASMNAYQTAKQNVLAEIGKACAAQAGALTEAYARIDLSATAPKVTILEPDATPALKTCLVERLAKASYPKRPAMLPAKAVDRVPLQEMPTMMPH